MKSIIIFAIFFIFSCDYNMERDNKLDPDSKNYIPPVAIADFASSVRDGSVRLNVDFTDLSQGDIVSWEWDFNNDGVIDSTEQNPSYTYNSVGKYTVTLKVQESRGLVSDEEIKSEFINVTFGHPIKRVLLDDCNGAVAIHASDIDSDGDMDVISAFYNRGEIIWLENDLSTAKKGSKGDIISWTEHKIAQSVLSVSSIFPVDIDGDGDIDILSSYDYTYTNGLAWWENRKGEDDNWKDNWTSHIIDEDFIIAVSVVASDIDSDGDMDVVSASYGAWNYEEECWENSEISWWENVDQNPGAGDGNAASWIKHIISPENIGADFKGIANIHFSDLDKDGDMDILSSERSTNSITWYENKKGELDIWKNSFVEHNVDDNFIHARYVTTEDVDGDGDTDIIGASRGDWNSETYKYEDSEICWWENVDRNQGEGDGDASSWVKNILHDDLNGAHPVITSDVDNDGDIDIIGASRSNDTVIWWENINGIGTEWTEHILNVHFHSASSLFAVDIDNDEDIDIIGSSYGNYNSYYNYSYLSQLAWWEITY
ncbi:MAG: FG-GAP-like repeat-containing protein [Spirochaetota bacterium]|nr:FG-GAP-like repeat-containing protein [Spirochaetota bacterium]